MRSRCAYIECSVFPSGVLWRDDDEFSPAGRGFAGIEHEAVGGGENRIAEIGVHAADAIQIVAGVMAAAFFIHLPEFLGVVNESAVFRAHRRIKTQRARDLRGLPGGEEMEAMIRLAVFRHAERRVRILKADALRPRRLSPTRQSTTPTIPAAAMSVRSSIRLEDGLRTRRRWKIRRKQSRPPFFPPFHL